MKNWVRPVGRWSLAVLVTTVCASIVQTQFNLAALIELGESISPPLRLQTTLHDLQYFAPLFAAIVAVGFLFALPSATWLLRRWPRQRWLAGLAGALAIAVALCLMRWLLGLTPIAAARGLPGFVALSGAGALGAWIGLRPTKVLS